MAPHTIYTRVYSKRSAGQLVSAKGPKGNSLSDTALAEEFRNHSDKGNRKPTALVSGSDRIVDTLRRAFEKHYEDGEPSADIWIAFIKVSPTINETTTRLYSAKRLAEKCGLSDPYKFSHEVVFEWAIPEKYVVHEVSLQTLMDRGLQEHYFLRATKKVRPTKEVRPTKDVRSYTAGELQQLSPWEIGLTLGSFAQKFGARAPVDWISHQLFDDCAQAKNLNGDVVRLKYADGYTEIVDSQFLRDVDDGIETVLYDWWLADSDFFLDSKEFREWRDVMEDAMAWELIEFWETWHDDATSIELSAEEELLCNEAENELRFEHERKRAAIEREAVRIGL